MHLPTAFLGPPEGFLHSQAFHGPPEGYVESTSDIENRTHGAQ